MASMIAASGDSLWFTMNSAGAVGHVRGGDSAIAVTELPRQPSGPVGIAVAADGSVWVAQILADALARIGRDGTITEVDLPEGAKPHAVAPAADGGIWATLWGTDQLARVDAEGGLTLHPLPDGESEPHGIAVAADGTVWVAMESGVLVQLS
jgi:virginiamycin B lyase